MGIQRVKIKKFLPLDDDVKTFPQMDIEKRLRHYKKLLSFGNLKQMLAALEHDLVNNEVVQKEVVALSSRVNILERDLSKGVIDYEVKTRLFNSIHMAASDLLDLVCLLYTSPSPRDLSTSRMPSSA